MAYTYDHLSLTDYHGQPLPNLFLRQKDATDHLAVLFPGYQYTTGMPLLYYPGLMLLEHGADVLRVEYTYSQQPGFQGLPEGERAAQLRADATAAIDAALAAHPYQRITLVGKSIGTRVLGEIAADVRLAAARIIWLTPLFSSDALYAQAKAAPQPGLFVIGSTDPAYHPARFAELAARPGSRGLVIPGADHSLEIAGNFWASLDALHSMLAALEAFLAEG